MRLYRLPGVHRELRPRVPLEVRPGLPLELRLDILREYTEMSAAPSPGWPVSVGRRCCETSGGGGTKRRGLGQRGERGVVQAGESSGGFTVSTVAQRAGRGEGLLSMHTVTHTTLLHSNRKTISRTLAELGAPYLFFYPLYLKSVAVLLKGSSGELWWEGYNGERHGGMGSDPQQRGQPPAVKRGRCTGSRGGSHARSPGGPAGSNSIVV